MNIPRISPPIFRDMKTAAIDTRYFGIEPSANCYSGRKCKGKILNHRDRHNCKRSGGKSWQDNGVCFPI